jgi:hypothetical protein
MTELHNVYWPCLFCLVSALFSVGHRIWMRTSKRERIIAFELDAIGLLACGVHASQAAAEG